MPYKGQFMITHCFTNDTVTLKFGATQIKYNIRRNKPYKLDNKVEDSSSKICMKMSTYELPVILFCIKPNLGTNYIIRCAQGHWR